MIREIFHRLDNNNSYGIEFDEFLEMMTATMILGNDLTKFKNYFRNKMVSIGFNALKAFCIMNF